MRRRYLIEILAVLKHFLVDSTAQARFNRHVMRLDNLDKDQRGVLKHIDQLYELFPEKHNITANELKVYIQSRNPTRDITHVSAVIDSAMAQDIGSEITLALLETVVTRHMASKIGSVVSPIISNIRADGMEEVDVIMCDWREQVTLLNKPDSLTECEMSYGEAIKYRAADSGIKWPVNLLNKCMGGVTPGLGLVIARPDTGKTSFILNCLAYFAHQLRGTDSQLLYCGNEEGIIGLKARCGVSLLGVPTQWAEENCDEFDKQVTQRNGNCIHYHGGVRSTRDVEVLVKRYNPIVTVLDQLPKFVLPGNTAEGPVGMANVYSWFREQSEIHGTLMLGVAQADAKSGIWINMNNINGSKTDVPGELDFGIGIGYEDEAGMETARFINLFKNKNKYGRKGRGEVSFDVDTCRYKG